MSSVELNEAFLAKIAGWEAMKTARALLATDKVLSSNWIPPILKGVVQEGSASYRAGLAIKDTINIENMCSCRQSRDWGAICAHSVAVGLHHLRRDENLPGPGSTTARRSESPIVSGIGSKAISSTKSARRGINLTDDPAQGERAELHVILPPNLEPALAKGKCMICFEAEWNGRRQPLNSLPSGKLFYFTKDDCAVIERAEALSQGETPAMLMLSADAMTELLPSLAGHSRITVGKSRPLAVIREPWRLSLLARLESSGEIVLTMKPMSQAPVLIVGKNPWVYRNDGFQPLGLPAGCLDVLHGPMRFNRSRVPQFLSQEWLLLQAGCDIDANFTLDAFTLEPQTPRFLLALSGGLAQLQAQLQCAYGARIMTVGVTSKEESLWLPDPANTTRYSTRDLAAELAALGRLLRSGFTGPDGLGRLQLLGQNGVLNFFAREYPKLQREWSVTLEERLEKSTKQNLERIEPRFEVTSSGVQWFDLAVSFSSASGERFSAAEIQRLVLSGQSHLRLKNGRTAVIDTGAVEELQEVLLDCSPDQHAQGYRINSAQAGFVESTLRQQPGWQIQAPMAWRDRAAKQSGETRMICPPLGPLESVLRPYQKDGVAWLHFLRENGFGGILADEMGLGKTLQTLAYLATVGRASVPASGEESLLSRQASPPVERASQPARGEVVSPSEQISTLAGATGGQGCPPYGRRENLPAALPFKAFDPSAPVTRYSRKLPHWQQDGATYFVTFRLGDSIPEDKLRQWHGELAAWLAEHPGILSDEEQQEYEERFTDQFHAWLDAGHGGCVLAKSEATSLLESSLRYFDGQRYQLGSFVIMPNHVHVLVRPWSDWKLPDILHSWKSFSASRINEIIGGAGKVWQDESFDIIVRTERHLQKYGDYIRDNPVKARLPAGTYRLGMGIGGQHPDAAVGRASVPASGEGPLLSGKASPPVERASQPARGEVVAPSKDVLSQPTATGGLGSPPYGRRAVGPTLVVCPTSLVFNWLAESAKFTPHLKTLQLHGPDRHALFDKIAESDLVVTSYALVRRDAEKYRGIEFDTVVLDEAQHIKNRQTQNAQAVKAIRSRHRLVLTGTPLENSVLDLWSIFDFLMPGYLGAARDFKERYEIPITREKNAESQARLGRRLRPFILRRLKRDVAKDLPEKLEQVAFCELTDDQRSVYRQIMEMSRKEVMDAVGAQGVAKSRMVVLNALLRLRQICCDLRLLKLEEKGKPVTDAASGKMEMFGELLDEALDGGHRVLVFSQFVSMLTLLKDRLTRDGVEFCYLDGSTSNRAEVVSRFQTTGTIPVFLISLKAGGVGLNLTGADTVIHFDPWWNPAVEDQATDRAHRIGQTRVVTSYKLIARDTVEEKILTLQNRKREIIKGTLEGEESLAEALSWEEIQELFS